MENQRRSVLAIPLIIALVLLSALALFGIFAPKAYAATSEPTGLQAYINGKPYSEFKVSDGANEDAVYFVSDPGSLEMKGLPDGWYYFQAHTFKQDDGRLSAGIGVTNGDKRYYWCFIGVSELVQSLDYIKHIKLVDVNAGGSELKSFDPTNDYTTTLDHLAFISIKDSALPYGWVVDVNQTGYTDWTVHPEGQSKPSVHWQIKSTCQRAAAAPTPQGLQIVINGTPLADFDPLKGGGGSSNYIDASSITGGSGTAEVSGLPDGWAYREIRIYGQMLSIEVTNGGITYRYLINGVSSIKHNTSELKGVRLSIEGDEPNFSPLKNQHLYVNENVTHDGLIWSFNFSTDNEPNHSAALSIPSGWKADFSSLDDDSILLDATIHPINESSPSVHWVIENTSGSSKGLLTRIAGETRYETMSAMVDKFNPDKGGAVILASADNYPDALTASSLSGMQNAPIILTGSNSLSSEARKQLEKIKPNKLYIVGGEAAVSKEVERSAVSAASCQAAIRFAGDTRYETALKIADGIGQSNNTVIVATGENFADALSISPFAQHFKTPIILSSPSSGLSNEAISLIKSKGASKAIIVGGTSAVPSSVDQQLKAAGVSNIQRFRGDTRYETSAKIAEYEKTQGMTTDGVIFAAGTNFPDALVAGPFAGKNNSIVLLADDTTIEWATEYTREVSKAFIAGGSSAVSEEIAYSIASLLNLEYIA